MEVNKSILLGELGMYSLPTIISSDSLMKNWKGVDYLYDGNFLNWFEIFENCKDGPLEDRIEPVKIFPSKNHNLYYLTKTKDFIKSDFANSSFMSICRLVKVKIYKFDLGIVMLDSSHNQDVHFEELEVKEKLLIEGGVLTIFPGEYSGEKFSDCKPGFYKSIPSGQKQNDIAKINIISGQYSAFELYHLGISVGIKIKYDKIISSM